MKAIERIARHAEVSEKALERYLHLRTEALGGTTLKYACDTRIGFPDRLVLLPHRRFVWCELKSAGKKPRPIQLKAHAILRSLGHEVHVCDSRQQIDDMLNLMNDEQRQPTRLPTAGR